MGNRKFSFWGVTKLMRFVPYDEFGMSYSDELLQKFPYSKSLHNVEHFLYLSCVLTMNIFHDTPLGFQVVSKRTILSVYPRKLLYIGVKTLVFQTT